MNGEASRLHVPAPFVRRFPLPERQVRTWRQPEPNTRASRVAAARPALRATSRLLPYTSMCHSPRRHVKRHTKGGGHTNTSDGTDVASEEPTAAASRRPTRRPMKHLRYTDPKTCPPSVRVTPLPHQPA